MKSSGDPKKLAAASLLDRQRRAKRIRSSEFAALGGRVRISIDDPDAEHLLPGVQAIVHQLHSDLTRFDPGSELSRLNSNPGQVVEVSPLMLRFLGEVVEVARASGGLVDATLVDAIERAGYGESRNFRAQPDPGPIPVGIHRHPAASDPKALWAQVKVDPDRGLVADRSDCALTAAASARDRAMAEMVIPSGHAVATSGITRRAWSGPDGQYRHHLIDPGTGLTAFTGVVQATAAAPTAVEAEVLAKAALLVGPHAATHWLRCGGVLVLWGGMVVEVAAAAEKPELAGVG